MPGFDTSTIGSVLYAQNVDFTGSSLTSGSPQVTQNGQLLIGANTAPYIRVNTLTAGSGISITNNPGAITIANTGQSLSPLANPLIYEEFLGGGTGPTTGFWTYPWLAGSFANSLSTAYSEIGHPGVIVNTSVINASFLSTLILTPNSSPATIFLGGGAISLNWILKINTLSNGTNRYYLRIGLGDTQTSSTYSNGVWFEYIDTVNSGNWTINTSASSSVTTANTSTAVTTGWVNLGITINAAATSIAYFVNGVQVANSPITTNIPILPISPVFKAYCTVGSVPIATLEIDAFYMSQVLTTSR